MADPSNIFQELTKGDIHEIEKMYKKSEKKPEEIKMNKHHLNFFLHQVLRPDLGVSTILKIVMKKFMN